MFEAENRTRWFNKLFLGTSNTAALCFIAPRQALEYLYSTGIRNVVRGSAEILVMAPQRGKKRKEEIPPITGHITRHLT